jgi:hypothetical protein
MSAKREKIQPRRDDRRKVPRDPQSERTNGQTPVTKLSHFFRESDSFFGEFSPKHYVIASGQTEDEVGVDRALRKRSPKTAMGSIA